MQYFYQKSIQPHNLTMVFKYTNKHQSRQQKQEELKSCSLWNENHIHRKIDKMKRHRTMYQMKEQDKTPEKTTK